LRCNRGQCVLDQHSVDNDHSPVVRGIVRGTRTGRREYAGLWCASEGGNLLFLGSTELEMRASVVVLCAGKSLLGGRMDFQVQLGESVVRPGLFVLL